jgi:hypothetical protein
VPRSFRFTLRGGTVLPGEEAAKTLLKPPRRSEVRSAGKGSKGSRWYAWAWIGTASGTHSVLVRRHLKTGELAFHYCYVPEGQPCGKPRLIRAAGLRWPVEEGFEFGEGPVRAGRVPGADLHRDRPAHRPDLRRSRHLRRRCRPSPRRDRHPGGTTSPPGPGPARRSRPHPAHRPADPPAARRRDPPSWPPDHIEHWDIWIRRHQARARWFHKRARLARDANISLIS